MAIADTCDSCLKHESDNGPKSFVQDRKSSKVYCPSCLEKKSTIECLQIALGNLASKMRLRRYELTKAFIKLRNRLIFGGYQRV